MPHLYVIQKVPGPTTTQRVLEVIQSYDQGITIKALSQALNRSVSMVQKCLKILIAEGLVYTQVSDNGMQLIYYPNRPLKAVKRKRHG